MVRKIARNSLSQVCRSGWRLLGPLVQIDTSLEFVGPATEFFERADHRLDPLRAEAEFLDQLHRPQPSPAQLAPSFAAVIHLRRLAGGNAIVGLVSPQQRFDRLQVVRQAAENLVLLQAIGHRDLHRAVERQFASMNALQNLDRDLNHVVAFQQLAAELGPRDFDLLGQGDFLLPREQRDFAHLRQIHPHRIVRPTFDVLFFSQQLFGLAVDVEIGHRGRIVHQQIVVHIVNVNRLVDQFDRLVGIRGHIIFQIVKQCVVQVNTPSLRPVLGGE